MFIYLLHFFNMCLLFFAFFLEEKLPWFSMPCVKVSMLTWQVGSVTSCMARRLDCSVFSWALMRSIQCSNLAIHASAIYKNKKQIKTKTNGKTKIYIYMTYEKHIKNIYIYKYMRIQKKCDFTWFLKNINKFTRKKYIKNSNENYIIKIQIYKICLPHHLQ